MITAESLAVRINEQLEPEFDRHAMRWRLSPRESEATIEFPEAMAPNIPTLVAGLLEVGHMAIHWRARLESVEWIRSSNRPRYTPWCWRCVYEVTGVEE